MFVYIQIYTDIYVRVFLGDNNLDIFYARKSTYPDLTFHLCARAAPGPCLGLGPGVKMYNRSGLAFGKYLLTLRKHAYSNILKILPPKNEHFQIKNSNIFHIPAQNIECGYSLEPPRRGGSNEYPQSVF